MIFFEKQGVGKSSKERGSSKNGAGGMWGFPLIKNMFRPTRYPA
jgi:hypothetical protein